MTKSITTTHPAGSTIGGIAARWHPAPLPVYCDDLGDVQTERGDIKLSGVLLRVSATGEYMMYFGRSARQLNRLAVDTALAVPQ